jgi:hypothetical protein
MNRARIIAAFVISVLLVLSVAACGDGNTGTTYGGQTTGTGGGQSGTSTTPTTVIVDSPNTPPQPSTPTTQGTGALGGVWNGQWANYTPDSSTGTFSIAWTQQGSTLTGNISIVGTPCLNGGAITGTVNGNSINFGVVEGQVTVNYAGTISGNTMSGTYATTCGNAEGNWTAAKQ